MERNGVTGYLYTAETTIDALLNQFFQQEKADVQTLADMLEVTPELVSRWCNNELTTALLTSHASRFMAATGIDLNRFMVVEAKRQLSQEQPDLLVPYDKYCTREEIIEVYAGLAKNCGTPVLAELIGVAPKSLSVWIIRKEDGEAIRRPDITNLKKLIAGLLRGINPGTRDDMLLRQLVTRIFGDSVPEWLKEMDTFQKVAQTFFSYKRRMSCGEFSRVCGIKRNTLSRLQNYSPNQANTMPETITAIIRYLVKMRQPELLRLFTASAPAHTEPKQESVDKAEVPKTDVGHLNIGHQQTQSSAVTDDQLRESLATWLLTGAEILRGKALRPAVNSESNGQAGRTDFQKAVSGQETVGEDISGLRFCVTAKTFQAWPGRKLSRAEQDDTAELVQELRRRIIVLIGLDPAIRMPIFDRLAPELDELWHALTVAKVEIPSYAIGLAEEERNVFADYRAARQRGGQR